MTPDQTYHAQVDQILFAYDPVNQFLSKTLPGAEVTSYTYSTVGNLPTVTHPDSALTMTYDLADPAAHELDRWFKQPAERLAYVYLRQERQPADGGRSSGTNTSVYDVLIG